MDYILLLGRIMFSAVFIVNGINHFAGYSGVSQYAAAMGVPLPGLATIVSGIFLILGGLSVILGFKAKIGSILLVVFLVLAAFMVHSFWAFDDPMQRAVEMAQFWKNLALAGAALIVFYFGTGPKSLEKKESK